ncbi:hypothetical protein GCM10027275_25080 [Rhabdobacter roseus]|uniref:Uncharacterized protein n=1 Tax=Rhabdobacter roseus TaxID=1655419 RepID=A0A840TW94_9BACT|nr:hypothetical protein [Rhabdobacter roseus]MBB5284448.1 hypothetical protein [Rhabdobacter roseus]
MQDPFKTIVGAAKSRTREDSQKAIQEHLDSGGDYIMITLKPATYEGIHALELHVLSSLCREHTVLLLQEAAKCHKHARPGTDN